MKVVDTTPTGFSPLLFGEIVSIQIIPKNGEELMPQLMTRHVGYLKYFAMHEYETAFAFEHGPVIQVDPKTNLVEIYKHKIRDDNNK